MNTYPEMKFSNFYKFKFYIKKQTKYMYFFQIIPGQI